MYIYIYIIFSHTHPITHTHISTCKDSARAREISVRHQARHFPGGGTEAGQRSQQVLSVSWRIQQRGQGTLPRYPQVAVGKYGKIWETMGKYGETMGKYMGKSMGKSMEKSMVCSLGGNLTVATRLTLGPCQSS